MPDSLQYFWLMNFSDARAKFIETWGVMGSTWGINRTMAQIHALLLIAPEPVCAETIMQELNISRGNVNMNVRALVDWGLAEKVLRTGERKEFFVAEKDIWVVAQRILEQRKKRELEPVINVLDEVLRIDEPGGDAETVAFLKTVSGIRDFAHQTEKIMERFSASRDSMILNLLLKMMK